MDYILKSRGRGKTYDLIQRSARTGERIVCANSQAAMFVNDSARRAGVKIPTATSLVDYLKQYRGCPTDKGIIVDELSWTLRQILPFSIQAATDTPANLTIDICDYGGCDLLNYGLREHS